MDDVFDFDPKEFDKPNYVDEFRNAGEVMDADFRDTAKHFSFNLNVRPKENEKNDLSLINPDFGVISNIDRKSSVIDTSQIRHSLNMPKLTESLNASDSFNNRVSNPSESESVQMKMQ